MQYYLSTLVNILQGTLLGANHTKGPLEQLLFDSRQLTYPENSIFFALKGPRNNGHDFIPSLYEQGVRTFVIQEPITPTLFPEAAFIQVAQVLKALQTLALYHRKQFDLNVIGITGSNGKTIVKEWLFQLLHPLYAVVRSPKSYNSQIGVPLSVWQINDTHELGIFEAGISEMNEMEHIQPIIDCQIGIFTNIGEAHSTGFPSRVEKIRQKLQLFKAAQLLIYRKDHTAIHEEIAKTTIPGLSWSTKQPADLQIIHIDHPTVDYTLITAEYQNQSRIITIPFSDDAAIENAIQCWSVLLYLGISDEQIAVGMRQLQPVAMRLELREAINNCTLINDSYNADLNGLRIALNFMEQQKRAGTLRTLILSDILQNEHNLPNLYKKVAKLVKAKAIHKIITIGKASQKIAPFLDTQIIHYHFLETDAFLQEMVNITFQDELILLKGARPFRFEKIAQRLSRKVHQTTLEVKLTALLHNLHVFQKRLSPNTKIMVMVKAAAYGSGSLEVARLLEFNKVDYLAVAYADEGVELRKAGIQLPILVLNPEKAVFDSLIRYQLEPEIYNLRLLEEFHAYLQPEAQNIPIHLKLDTGMHRLGFEKDDIPALIQFLQQAKQLQVQSVFSHLAGSEAAIHDDFTKQQIQIFQELANQLSEALGYTPIRHILNSAGIVRFPEFQLDMVRLGIGLYGVDGSNKVQQELQDVLSLKASISQIKTIPKGETVGYGRKGVAQQNMQMATVSIGYADGLLRLAGNKQCKVFVKGIGVPIIGNVCMDMCMIDISELKEVQEGEEVIIFENRSQLEALAKALHTIPYEVLTNISPRVKRIYIQD